ncbi:MAG TPA: RagB/SusD family nutrient uptake outer membrane protein [Bacteroidales bacterium]|nr:RagB/SusD family nutrient uptake outer membrane protein [Bacteroidales bacterium]
MKKIYKFTLIPFVLGLMAMMFACTNLDETVYDTIPADQFGKKPAEINAIIAPIYKTLKNVWPSDIFLLSEQSGDMAMTPTRVGGDWWDGGVHMEMKLHTWEPRNGLIRNSWDNCMSGITTCNQIYATIEVSEMDADLKEQTLAEIRGIRAYWYYILIDYFGNAPLVSDYESTELPGMSTRQQLYDFVVSELNEIKDQLRDDVSDESYGKFTRGAAYTLLARMYLNAGVWTGTPNWQGVVDACDEVMELDYIIEPVWKTSFEVNNQVSREIILPAAFGKADGGNHMHYRTLHYLDPIALGMNIGTWNGVSAQPDYVKQFDDADPRKEGSFLMGPMINPATGEVLVTGHGRDLNHTVDFNIIPGTEREGMWGEVNQEEGARVNKWVYEKGLSNSDQENDFAIFRLADVYLMKAEALLRLGQNNAEATSLINEIRERAFGSDDYNYESVTLDELYLERRLELAWENSNRQDMIRFGNFLKPGYLRPQTSPEHLLLFPIPETAWETNNNLVQNPGYPAF